jgi:hypothetical protein
MTVVVAAVNVAGQDGDEGPLLIVHPPARGSGHGSSRLRPQADRRRPSPHGVRLHVVEPEDILADVSKPICSR